MSETIVLRFRDLVTEPGGTISEHAKMIDARGHVWWGWWMRQYETPPADLFAQIYATIQGGVEPDAFLFDSGQSRLYRCRISDLSAAPDGETIGPPELDTAPAYYQRGAYPAWFKLSLIESAAQTAVPEGWTFAAFPANPNVEEHQALLGDSVESLEQLRKTDTTLWLVSTP